MDILVAQKLKNHKQMSKTKVKKTIKNVVCRPDHLNWNLLTDQEKLTLETVLQKHKVTLPEFKKPHWKDVKSLPKEKRPRPPPCKKVDGLIFGLTECQESIKRGICSGIMLDSDINPKLLAEPIIEDCCNHFIPHLSLKDLKKTSASYFGIPTCCLGIKKDSLFDIQNALVDIFYQKCKPEKTKINNEKEIIETPMVVDDVNEIKSYPYLYRKTKKERVFTPSQYETTQDATQKFSGQNFIGFSENQLGDCKMYKKMILKRMCSNPKRIKK